MGHVQTLTYKLDSLFPYEATPIAFEADGVRFDLSNDVLQASPNGAFETIAAARQVVETVLRNWILEAKLLDRHGSFRFAYQNALTVDRVDDALAHSPEAIHYSRDEDDELVITLTQYPAPPVIKATPDLEAAAERLHRASTGFGLGEPLQGAAYFVLTLAERIAGSRKSAAILFATEERILARIGQLSSTRGDASTARKASAQKLVAMSKEENRWLDLAARFLLLQMGQVSAGRIPAKLTLEDIGSPPPNTRR